ncbi:DUF262 domain-containing protein [Campylobacter volucris]|uniref:DUF262 domain-containing protein n=1 Tax=Campylobacter volucris TaxID=1031542 RepID=UPI00189D1DF0|nr:DUF262 domain-containing protein [Campylobacter volucris]MBF7069543.1 DUF262 domain-containing protein [Campylobacter volucris]
MANNSTNNQNQASVISIGSIDNKEQSIFFEIPPYQRLYEWNKEQIQTLLNDIKTKFDEDKKDENKNEYFIGNVVVSKKDDKYLLIDGQQRLTTLFLIGFFLSYKKCENWQNFIMQDNKLRISMPIREKEEKVLKEFAKFCNECNNRENDLFLQKLKEFPQDISQNIPQALETIVNWFKENIEENIKENIENFSKFIYSNVKFVFVKLAENTDLNRFFIRMNNRGKQLEKHEILKARLLSKINDDKSERTLYAHIWDICSQMDNYIFQKASDRKISKSNESSKDDKQKNTIDDIIKKDQQKITKKDDDEDKSKFKSIVDFPTFLLHVYKLAYLEEDKNEISKITIDKNKLLEIIKIEEKEAKNFIENLLKYRILFDYFVVKGIDDVENSYKIRRLSKNKKNNTYTISEDSNEMPDLAMVQNYLRVARSGMSNNHHHWLTPFLKFLYKNIELKIAYDKVGDSDKQELQIKINEFNIITNFQDFLNKLNLSKDIEKKLIEFLENLDTALAKEQASTTEQNKNKKDLLEISNEVFITLEIKDKQMSVEDTFFNEENKDITNLDQGTATLHYWFYRLEYYLWKYSKIEYISKVKDNEKLKEINWGNFSEIASSFYFRNLNSIEHVQAQSKAEEWGEDKEIDNFGNLALISSSFNSSLNNQDVQSKYRDFQKRYIDDTKKAIISLKLWLIYALAKDGEDKITWTFEKAKKHKEQMLKILKNSFESNQR